MTRMDNVTKTTGTDVTNTTARSGKISMHIITRIPKANTSMGGKIAIEKIPQNPFLKPRRPSCHTGLPHCSNLPGLPQYLQTQTVSQRQVLPVWVLLLLKLLLLLLQKKHQSPLFLLSPLFEQNLQHPLLFFPFPKRHSEVD